VRPTKQWREGERAGDERVVEHGHLDDQAAYTLGRQNGGLERRVGAERGPANHRPIHSEVVEQRDRLRAEDGHRVAPHVGGR
jgi:hypothetical protein